MDNKPISPERCEELFDLLEERFGHNPNRHEGIEWEAVRARLETETAKLRTLSEMERTGGEPDVTGRDEKTGEYIFCDCSPESPSGRRNLCYDRQAWEARKENRPAGSAVETAAAMGIELLNEEQYRALQQLGDFDTRTSSWLDTPVAIRRQGGAVFGDKRYGRVFVYHNGAESYYAARGFRGLLKV